MSHTERVSQANGGFKPSEPKSLTTVEIRVYEGHKLMELRRHPITYAFPNSTDEIIVAPKVLRAGEYPHDDQVTLFGFKVEIEAALLHIKVNDLPTEGLKQSDGFTESPSSRPMTLRQQLAEIITPSAYGFDQYHDSSCPECMFDFKEARDEIEALCQEIAREARLDEQDKLTVQILNNSGRSDFLYLISKFNSVRVKDIKSELTQKPPQPPQGGLEEVSDGSS